MFEQQLIDKDEAAVQATLRVQYPWNSNFDKENNVNTQAHRSSKHPRRSRSRHPLKELDQNMPGKGRQTQTSKKAAAAASANNNNDHDTSDDESTASSTTTITNKRRMAPSANRKKKKARKSTTGGSKTTGMTKEDWDEERLQPGLKDCLLQIKKKDRMISELKAQVEGGPQWWMAKTSKKKGTCQNHDLAFRTPTLLSLIHDQFTSFSCTQSKMVEGTEAFFKRDERHHEWASVQELQGHPT